MKRNIKSLLALVTVVTLSVSLSAQTLQNSYFMTEMTGRHRLNPAFKTANHYVGMPAVSNFYTGVNSNVGLGTFLYPREDKLVTFLHESVSADEFLGKLSTNNAMELDLGLNLLSFGFWAWGGQNTFDLSLKSSTGFYLPKDLFRFLKTGQEPTGVTNYSLGNMTIATNNYIELAFGHARNITDRLSVGANLKVLLGAVYGEVKIDQMDISMSQNEWYIKEQGRIAASSLIQTEVDPVTGEIKKIDFSADNFSLPGFGLGLDLGATYKLLDNLTLSASVTDIGFMSWNNLTCGESDPNNEFVYRGFDNIGAEDDADGNNAFDDSAKQLEEDLTSLFTFYESESKSVSQSLRSTLRVGAEYGILNDKISFGLLSTTRFVGHKVYAEGMAAVNFRPLSVLHVTLNGSLSNMGHSFGGVINVCAPGFNLFVGTDYVAGNYSKQFIPVNNAHVNVCLGLNFTFGKKHSL